MSCLHLISVWQTHKNMCILRYKYISMYNCMYDMGLLSNRHLIAHVDAVNTIQPWTSLGFCIFGHLSCRLVLCVMWWLYCTYMAVKTKTTQIWFVTHMTCIVNTNILWYLDVCTELAKASCVSNLYFSQLWKWNKCVVIAALNGRMQAKNLFYINCIHF